LADGKERTTKGLATELYATALGADSEFGLQVIMRDLLHLATHDLSDVAKHGPAVAERVRTKGGRWVQIQRRHWRWGLWGERNEDAKGFCPHCGGKL
jgi:hypothetical protein